MAQLNESRSSRPTINLPASSGMAGGPVECYQWADGKWQSAKLEIKMRLNVTANELSKIKKLELNCNLGYGFDEEKWTRGTAKIINVCPEELPLYEEVYIKVVDEVVERFTK